MKKHRAEQKIESRTIKEKTRQKKVEKRNILKVKQNRTLKQSI